MNLLLSDEQTQIVDSLKVFLRDRAPVSRFRPPAAQIGNTDHEYWPQLAELGFLGISIPEEQGGALVGGNGGEGIFDYPQRFAIGGEIRELGARRDGFCPAQ